jgi:hypothetical protein
MKLSMHHNLNVFHTLSSNHVDDRIFQFYTIHSKTHFALTNVLWISNFKYICGFFKNILYRELIPSLRNTRINNQIRPFFSKASDAVKSNLIHPTSCTCIPAPATSTYMRLTTIYIGRNDIGLDFVDAAFNICSSMINGINHFI